MIPIMGKASVNTCSSDAIPRKIHIKKCQHINSFRGMRSLLAVDHARREAMDGGKHTGQIAIHLALLFVCFLFLQMTFKVFSVLARNVLLWCFLAGNLESIGKVFSLTGLLSKCSWGRETCAPVEGSSTSAYP